MRVTINELKARAITAKDIGTEDALTLYGLGMKHPFVLIAAAAEIREHFKGRKVNLCGIVNAKSGLCSEDCKFCAQSAHYCTDAPEYPFIGKTDIVEKARQAKASGAHMFGIITSGTRVDSEDEWNEIYGAINEIRTLGIKPCVSPPGFPQELPALDCRFSNNQIPCFPPALDDGTWLSGKRAWRMECAETIQSIVGFHWAIT
jgi:biotin synthase-like enzyme